VVLTEGEDFTVVVVLTEAVDFTVGAVFTEGAVFTAAGVFAAELRSEAVLAAVVSVAGRDSAAALRFGLAPDFAAPDSVEDFAADLVAVFAADSVAAVLEGADGVGVVGDGVGV
jgi:hypothetical protein